MYFRFWPVRTTALVAFLAALSFFSLAAAGDWPQILGPDRNGIARDEKIAEGWLKSGPKVLWRRQTGSGFAGVAVANGRVVLFHRQGDEEIAEAMNAADGKVLWKASFPTSFMSSFSSDHGPRCVPLIHKDRVFLFGAQGRLHCVALADGKKVWSREAFKDYGAPEGYFGAGSSPIVIGDKLLVNVGGSRQDAGVVAFFTQTGKTLWKATDEMASYSSPVAAAINGVPQAVFVTRYHALGIKPANGDVLWRLPFGKRGPTVNGANPLVRDGRLFLSASYGIGAVYADVRGPRPKVLWQNDEVMSSQYTTSVYREGRLYGIDGRHDVGTARLRCFDPKTGKVAWTKEGVGKASLILADGKLIVQTTSGNLILVRATPQGYQELAQADVLPEGGFALPALANGRLFVRGPKSLKCLDLRR